MRIAFLIILTVGSAFVAAAQSGRVKPAETPTPVPVAGPVIRDVPPPARPSFKPTPTPKPNDDPDVIKVESALVPIPVSVLNSAGEAVTGLTARDFELRIDDKPAEIADITRSETPIRLAMIFDNSSSVMIARDFEKEAAEKFFRRIVRPDRDLAALFSLSDYTRLEQPLTRDVSLLTRAIELFPDPKGATALLDGIIQVAKYLKSAQGRRVVVIVSDGEDTYSDMRTTLEDVVKSLQINDCQVYVVKTKDFENYKRTGARGGNANIRALTAERRMIEIARETGGSVYSPIDEAELDEAFNQISAELSQQYVISYYPEDEAGKQGEFRRISLLVKGKQNLTIRARKGYYVGRK
jgi:Ca-activated chloride channel homolog